MIQIEKNIALPGSRVDRKQAEWNDLRHSLPFEAMLVGDSFALSPADFDTDQLRLQNYLSGSACSYRKDQEHWDFTTRQMPDGTVRVWRTA